MFGILIAVILLIIYGSLYPWRFEPKTLAHSPLWILFHSWGGDFSRYEFFDIIVNVVLYIPLGMSAALAFRRYRIPMLTIAGPLILATVLSAAIEMTQIFEPTRFCSAIDFSMNITGSALGVIAALLFAELSDGAFGAQKQIVKDPAALALLPGFIAFFLFPIFPVFGRTALRYKLAAFVHAPPFAPIPFLSAALSWFAVGRLLEAVGFRFPRRWLALSLLLIPAQFFIVGRQPEPAQLLGAIAGSLLYLLRGTTKISWAFLALIVLRGMAPFHLTAQAQPFSWLPFGGFLAFGDWQPGVQLLLEKVFYYGVAIWLLRNEGVRWATTIVVVTLAAIEIVQTHLPGRTSEITDPLLAILLGAGTTALKSDVSRDAVAV